MASGMPVSPNGATARSPSPAPSHSSEESSTSTEPESSVSECSTNESGASAVPGRKRMCQFLEDLLNGGEVDGLQWFDKDEKIFRLPWKHAKKTNYDAEKDGKLCKLWAINTGKYKEGDRVGKAEPITWKINFRCALNSLHETIMEEANDVSDDFRIFRFLDRKPSSLKRRKCVDLGGACAQDHMPPTECVDGYLPPYQLLPQLNQFPWGYEAEFDHSPASSHEYDYSHQPAKMPYLGDPRFGVAGFTTGHASDLLNLPGNLGAQPAVPDTMADSPSPAMSTGASSRGTEIAGCSEFDPSQFGAEAMGLNSRGQSVVAAPPHPAANTGSDRPLVSTEIFVKVSYRSSPVAGMRVAHPQGCRIFYGAPPPHGMPMQTQESLFGPRTLMQLSLPHPNEAQALLPAMWEVLGAMHRGLVIEVRNNDIYATRLCRAAIFWGPPGHDGLINKLERCKRTRVFSYQSFLQTYDSYQHPQRVNIACYPPAYEIVLGIAQPWGKDRLRDNNLLTITLVHALAEKLIESLHCFRWQKNEPFDNDYVVIDSETPEDKLASNAAQHMVKAGRQPGALHSSREDGRLAGASIQHPAVAAMSTAPSTAAPPQPAQSSTGQGTTTTRQPSPQPQIMHQQQSTQQPMMHQQQSTQQPMMHQQPLPQQSSLLHQQQQVAALIQSQMANAAAVGHFQAGQYM